MRDELYTVIALGMRYWFTLLGLLIVWRAFHWLRRDRREKHRRLRQLPDAGMVGEFVSLNDAGEMTVDDTLPVPREGVLGRLYSCDVPVLCGGVAKYHIDLYYEDGLGLRVVPRRGLTLRVNGEEMNRAEAKEHGVLVHGDVLQVGDAALRLRLFAGLSFKRPARKAPNKKPSRGNDQSMNTQPYAPVADWTSDGYAGFGEAPEPWQTVDLPWEDSGHPAQADTKKNKTRKRGKGGERT